MKFYIVVNPGGNMSGNFLYFTGQQSVSITGTGGLHVQGLLGSIDYEKPEVYQVDNNNERIVLSATCSYTQSGSYIGFAMGSYNNSLPMIIEMSESPAQSSSACIDNLCWSTYFGGATGQNIGFGVWFNDVKATTNDIFVTGVTGNPKFPVTPGVIQVNLGSGSDGNACIVDFSSIGALKWATFYGGGGFDQGNSIETDNSGNIYVTGSTLSTAIPFPTTQPSGALDNETHTGSSPDAFILKISSDGTKNIWATFFGTDNEDQFGRQIKIDPSGTNLFVVGEGDACTTPILSSGSFNSSSGGGFILKFTLMGKWLWGTQYGGPDCTTNITSIAFDANGNFIVAGSTVGSGMNVTNAQISAIYNGGQTDAFLAQFTISNNTLNWSTYYGGNNFDIINSLSIDQSGNIYGAGYTLSNASFQLMSKGGYYQNAPAGSTFNGCILETDNTGKMLWSTYYGGGSGDDGDDIAKIVIDKDGDIYITGSTSSTNFPLLSVPNPNAFSESTFNAIENAFIVTFDKNANQIWTTYFGGINMDQAWGMGISPNDDLYVVGVATSNNASFPLVNPGGSTYFDGTNTGAFISQFGLTLVYPVGIHEVSKDNKKIKIFPNPASNFLIILFDGNVSGNVMIEVFNTIGQKVISVENKERKNQINLPVGNLASGLYQIFINDQNERYSVKFAKE